MNSSHYYYLRFRSFASAHTLLTVLLFIGGAFALVLLLLFLKPIGVPNPLGTRNPTTTYMDALARYNAVLQRENDAGNVNPVCKSKLLTHGDKTAQTIVFFHGFTNCPEQFQKLGQQFFDMGYNVYIPRMPHHGELDREKNSLPQLTTEELIDYGNDAVDIATGLGDEVTVFGLSGGGTVASYLGQYRDEIKLASPSAAYLGLAQIPPWLEPAVVNLGDLLPSIDFGATFAQASGSGIYAPYAYFNNNTRAAVAFMRLALITLADAEKNRSRATSTLTIINDADDTVNQGMIESLVKTWERLDPNTNTEYHFDAKYKIPHDMIGPDRIDQQTDLVYPILIQLLTGQQP